MNDKEKILQTLKDFGRLPKYRLASIAGIYQDKAEKLLQELLLENKVICHKETVATYWEIKK